MRHRTITVNDKFQRGYRYQLTFNVTAVTTAGTLTFRTTNADGSLNDLNVAVSTTGAKTFTLDVKADSVLQIVIGGETVLGKAQVLARLEP